MSSKFKDLMAKARARHEEIPEEQPQLPQVLASAGAKTKPAPIAPATSDTGAAKEQASTSNVQATTETPDTASANMDEREAVGQLEATPKKRGRPPGKRSHPDFEQVSAYISKDTYRNVKIALLQEGQSREFSELVEHLLAQWLSTQAH